MLGGGAGEDVEMSLEQPPWSTFIGGRPPGRSPCLKHTLEVSLQRVGLPAGVGGGVGVCLGESVGVLKGPL